MRVLTAFLALLALLACSPSEPPEAVASRFWLATLSGDEAGAWDASVATAFNRDDFNAARHAETFDSVTLGPARGDQDRSLVETRLSGVFFGTAGHLEFDTVLRRVRSEWKVDYQATSSRMIGSLLQDTVLSADQLLRESLGRPDASLGDAVREDLRKPPVVSPSAAAD